ncbi:nucleotide triphosphate diphosphatase NUDT15 [Kitasatospora nipponensis]|uniref:nucleotide triphosphate diphosphatase NUDT15 n=1 Tax=Kitasatospora nipponensis TaxID=258049 RepID=UPI0031E3B10C
MNPADAVGAPPAGGPVAAAPPVAAALPTGGTLPTGGVGRPLIGAGVIVPAPGGLVLLGRRITAGEPPTWSLPGGKVDHPGESFEQAAARELAEETGIELPAERMRVLGVLLDHLDGRPRLTAAVLAPPSAAPAEVTEPHACAGWQRFAVDALPGPMFGPSAWVLAQWLADPAPLPPGVFAYRTVQ